MRVFSIILSILFIGGSFVSCSLETSDNGKLDGFWRMVSIDTIATQGTLNTENKYWAFQYNLLRVQNQNHYYHYLLRFKYTGDSLIVSEPYKATEFGDTLLTTADSLKPFGINSTEEHFKIVYLSSKRMELKSQILNLKFRKL